MVKKVRSGMRSKGSGKPFLFTPKSFGVGLILMLIISSVAGYSIWAWRGDITAKASTIYTPLGTSRGVTVGACNLQVGVNTQFRFVNSSASDVRLRLSGTTLATSFVVLHNSTYVRSFGADVTAVYLDDAYLTTAYRTSLPAHCN